MTKSRKYLFGQEWYLYSAFLFFILSSIVILNSPTLSTIQKSTTECLLLVFLTFATISKDWKNVSKETHKGIVFICLVAFVLWCAWHKNLYFKNDKVRIQPQQ